MRLILSGPPGAGKGTQAQLLCSSFSLAHVSTGDMLRQFSKNDDDFGREIRTIMQRGQFVSDDIIIRLITKRIEQPDAKNGFVFDGFPRTTAQAKAILDLGIELDYVIEIVVPDKVIVKRMSGRRIHPSSGRVYHIDFHPPKVPDKDDVSGEPLIQRSDDSADTVAQRLKIYHQQTGPLNSFFLSLSQEKHNPQYIRVDGTQDVQEIHKKIVQSITSA